MSRATSPERRRRPLLFEPVAFRGVTARNRIMMSPMCQYCAPAAVPREWHFVHLGTRAAGGVGIVMTEATAVEPRGRISPYDVGIWSDEQEQAFGRIAAFVKEQGAVAGMQLAHAGRKASHGRPGEDRQPIRPEQGGWEVVGPSPIPWEPGDLMPRELSPAEIGEIVGRFRAAAQRALRAGFQLLEIHAAHGYLFHSFLSPVSNHRDDEYGGCLENRMRFLGDTVVAVREVWPADLPLFVRLSVTDWVEGGWSLSDSIAVARRLAGLGVDLIDCSSGGGTPEQKVRVHPGYQVPLAEAIRREAGLPTAAVGLISSPQMAEEILANGRADLVVLGRMLLWDPYWPHHAASELQAEVALPVQYARSGIYA